MQNHPRTIGPTSAARQGSPALAGGFALPGGDAAQSLKERNGQRAGSPVADRTACLSRRADVGKEWRKMRPSSAPHDAPTPFGFARAVEAAKEPESRNHQAPRYDANQAGDHRYGEISNDREGREGGGHWVGSVGGRGTPIGQSAPSGQLFANQNKAALKRPTVISAPTLNAASFLPS